jgi:hypothetical protein
MRQNRAARRSSVFEDLFAERQVYLRSGRTSRYVVLSRPLQIAVTIGAVVVVLWLAVASYRSVSAHLEAAERTRELTRLEEVNQSLRTAAAAAPSAEDVAALQARVPERRTGQAAARAGAGRSADRRPRRRSPGGRGRRHARRRRERATRGAPGGRRG